MKTGYESKITVTRPANTTTYTAGDVVGGVIEFLGANPPAPARHMWLVDFDFRIDLSAIPSGMSTFTLHLFDTTPPSALADNAPWDGLSANDRPYYIGSIANITPVDLGATLYYVDDYITKKYKSVGSSLFGYLVTTAGYTPTSGEVYTLRINTVEA